MYVLTFCTIGDNFRFNMKAVSASHARNNFSELLSLVAFKGEEFIIKRKGKTVAIIGPKRRVLQKKNKESVKSIVAGLTKHSLGLGKMADDWSKIEEILEELHTPHL